MNKRTISVALLMAAHAIAIARSGGGPLSGTCAKAAPVGQDTTALPTVNRVRIYPRAGLEAALVGGKIQGSNQGPTGGFVDLATISQVPQAGQWTEITFDNKVTYQFVRYFSPPQSWGNIAELRFFSNQSELTGQTYGTYGSRNGSGNGYEKAFDGDTKTFFEAPLPNDQYVGLNLTPSPSVNLPTDSAQPSKGNKDYRHYHVGNSLTDSIGEHAQAIAKAAGHPGDFMDRQTIPGSPLRFNWDAPQGFGTPYRQAFVKDAPLDGLVLQVYIPNGDNQDPSYSLKFYDLARENSPQIRPWIYAQWPTTGTGNNRNGTPDWDERNLGDMRLYMTHLLKFLAQRPDSHARLIPGGTALGNLKQAIDSGKVPGITNFFAANYEDDGHLSTQGRYFMGLVHYCCFYGVSPVGLPQTGINNTLPRLTPDQLKIYQQIAWDSVQNFEASGGREIGIRIPASIDGRAHVGSSVAPRDPYMRYLGQGSNFDYLLNVPKADRYQLQIDFSAGQSDHKMNVFVDEKAVGNLVAPAGKETFLDSQPLALDLKVGLNLLRLEVPENRPYDFDILNIFETGRPLLNTLPKIDLSAYMPEIAQNGVYRNDFNISDAQTPADQLEMQATSDNQALVPDANIGLEATDPANPSRHRLVVAPVTGQTGRANVKVTVTDAGGLKKSVTINLKVK